MGLKSALGSLVAGSGRKVLGNLGLGIATYGVTAAALTSALALVVSYIGGIPGEALNFMLLCGVGQGLSIIGAAILTANAMHAQRVGLGRSSS